MKNNEINILAISGSLKSTSANSNILRAIRKMAPQNVIVNIFNGLDKLPHFNPEFTGDIEAVNGFRQQLRMADGVIFSTPEYAFGVPGVLKNSLDWIVSSGELNKMPVAAISASPLYSGGDKALRSLLLTLTALGADMGVDSSLSIATVKSKITDAGEVTSEETATELKLLLDGLLSQVII
jgi:NAD(P)H-dependent FMN reductase